MHKWLQLPATPTDDPLATVYPINQYKKSHVYAVTRINPIYVDDEHHGTWNKSGSSGYDSQPHSDHSSLDKNSPPATKSDRSSAGSAQRTAAPWLAPIKEGVIDVRPYCIPRPVWPGHDDRVDAPADDADANGAARVYASNRATERIPRAKCCRHCTRCRCRGRNGTGSSASSSSDGGGNDHRGGKAATAGGCGNNGGSYFGYSSTYGGSAAGTISTNSSTSTTTTSGGGCGVAGRGDQHVNCTGSCSDEAHPVSSGSGSVGSANLQSPLHAFDPRFSCGVHKTTTLDDNWNSIDLRLNQKTDNLQYDCGAMLRGLQFTLDAQQAEKLMQKIKVGKKHRCWCRLVTALLGLIMFLVSVITVSLTLSRGQKMFGSL